MSGSASSLPARTGRALSNRLLVLEAVLALLPAAIAIRLLPFARVIGPARRARAARAAVAPRRLAWAVEVARRKVPWRAMCFESALALRTLLRRRGIPCLLHYGIARDEHAELKAHVWLSVDGDVLIGGETAPQFACVATFPSEAAD